MLKLAHQFKKLIILSSVFLIGAKAPIIAEDYIVLEVSSKAYDLSSLKSDFRLIQGFSCIYPSSLFIKLVGIDKSDNWLSDVEKLSTPLKKSQVATFNKMIRFYKLTKYVTTQQVYLASSLTRLLKQSFSVNGCTTKGLFNKELMTQNLTVMAKLEVMFSERKQRLSRFDAKKLDNSLNFIYSAIDKQITHRLLWQ